MVSSPPRPLKLLPVRIAADGIGYFRRHRRLLVVTAFGIIGAAYVDSPLNGHLLRRQYRLGRDVERGRPGPAAGSDAAQT